MTSQTNQAQARGTMTVLITGTGERADRLADIMRAAGHQVTVVEPTSVVGQLSDDLPATIDAYLQLPGAVTLHGDNLVGRVRSFLADGLLTRFDLVERVLPLVAPNGTVALVAGNIAEGSPVPDDRRSRLALLEVLARATRAELAERNVRVRVVVGHHDDEELVSFLLGDGEQSGLRMMEEVGPPFGKEYQDWRTEMMGLMSPVPT